MLGALLSLKRAGAGMMLTPFAKEAARLPATGRC
jgi:delta-aminolevulinic acid dehydratase/porphobilinogen synthase